MGNVYRQIVTSRQLTESTDVVSVPRIFSVCNVVADRADSVKRFYVLMAPGMVRVPRMMNLLRCLATKLALVAQEIKRMSPK